MNTTNRPRITIEDLQALEQLTPEELARILGAGRRGYQPTVEALEDRQVPSATPTAIASAITHSQENYAGIVNQDYHQFLGRAPDSAGLGYWVAAKENGLSDEGMEAAFLSSPEYIQEHGGIGAGWVQGIYQDLLGRTPSGNETNYWLGELNKGVSPMGVAYGFATSQENAGLRVVADYQNLLGRMPSQNEVAYWRNAIQNGENNEDVVAGFVGSTEFYNNAGGNTNPALWLASAYRDVLNRAPTDQECLAWLGRVPHSPTNGFLAPPQAVVGQHLNQVPVFHFSDTDPGAQASQFTVSLQTGDGTWLSSSANPQNVRVAANPSGGFDVLFTYTYSSSAANTSFAVTVTDASGVTIGGSTGGFAIRSVPVVTLQPSNQTVAFGGTATFAAAAFAVPSATVQWQVSANSGNTWNNIPGAVYPTLSWQPQTADFGNFYRAVFTNAVGQAITNSAMLLLAPPTTSNQQDFGDAAAQEAAACAAAQQAANSAAVWAAAELAMQQAGAQQAADDAAAQLAAADAAAQQAAQQAAADAAAQQAANDAAAQQAANDAAAQQAANDAAAQQAAADASAQQAAADAAAQQAAAQQAANDAGAQQAANDASAQQAAAQQAADAAAAQQAAADAAAQQAAQQAAADAAAQQAAADAAAQQAAADAAAQQAAQQAAAQQAAQQAAAQQAAADAAAQQAADAAAAQQAAADAAAQQAAQQAAAQQAANDAAAQQAAADAAAQQAAADAAAQQAAADAAAQQAAADAAAQQAAADAAAQQAAADAAAQQAAADAAAQQDY